MFSPNSVVSLGVLTAMVNAGCLIGGARIHVWLIRCYLRYIHSPRDLRSAFDCAGSQKLVCWHGCMLRLRSCCAFSDLVVTFSGRRNGHLVLWRSKVDFSWQVQGRLTSMCKLCARCSTLDTAVVLGALCSRGRCNES